MPILTTLGAACAKAWGFTSGLITDQYFNLVSLLLPGNGTNGAQNNTFLDSSTNNFTITRNGNTTQGTFSPFSQTGWGGYFNGSSSLTPSSGSFFALGTSNYTIEFWIYLTQNVGNNHALAINDTNGLVVVVGATKTSLNQFGVGDVLATGSGLSINTWNHVAIVRAGTGANQTSIYINGSRSVQGTDATNWTATTNQRIGGNTSNQYIFGYMSNVRVVTSAIYSGASITVPTTPLTAISGTTFLTLQNNRFLDNGSTAATFTTTGSPSVVAFSPFAPTAAYTTAAVGGSGYFDGTGDYLSVASNAAFATPADFTWEAWVYRTTTSDDVLYTGNVTDAFVVQIISNAVVIRQFGVANLITSSATVPTYAWTHIAVARSGTTLSLWINGSRTNGGTTTNSTSFAQNGLLIGVNDVSTNYLDGYLSGLRLVKGTAVYDPTQTSITVPTAPLTAIANTSLLLNFTNAGITDATAKNDLETVGNAQISTSVSKFGGGSIAFDGTGDYLFEPHSTLYEFGSGDFTIEFWARANSLSGTYTGVVGVWVAGGTATANSWNVQLNAYNATNKFGFSYTQSSTSYDLVFNATTSTGSWDHYAIVRSGGTLYGFKNGTSQTLSSGSSTISGAINNGTNGLYIGTVGTAAGGTDFNGYIDDLRITRGLARYTSNFTPPSAPFPVQ